MSKLANKHVIKAKWLYKRKEDENSVISIHKSKMVAQGYTQIERINIDQTFAHVAHLESIRLLI